MRIVELIRLEESDTGTIGVLKIDKRVFCMTLEPADRVNKPNISSIPAQQYVCVRDVSPRFGETFQVLDVPDRSDVLFHSLNVVEETEGCIGLGQHVDKLRGQRAILNSGKTFKRFMRAMIGEDRFHLTIKEDY